MTKITFTCAHCKQKLRAAADRAGKAARCPACRQIVRIPEPGSPAQMGRTRKAQGPTKRSGPQPPIAPSSQPPDHALIDMTAMVDIVFFLLIFFMVTSMHRMQSSIDLPTPEARPDSRGAARISAAANDHVVVEVDADDTVTVDGDEVPSRQELIARLRAAQRETMLVLASGDAMHGSVVMVLDAGSDAGIEEVRLVTAGLGIE